MSQKKVPEPKAGLRRCRRRMSMRPAHAPTRPLKPRATLVRRMPRTGWLLLATVLLTLPTLAPAAQPFAGMTYTLRPDGSLALLGVDPQGGTATLVSDGAEPHILVDRLGRSILVGDQLGVSISLDGGQTWFPNTPPFIPGHDPIFGIGIYDGWSLAQDDAGTIYASTTDGAIINVASSRNGGLTWDITPSTFVVDPGVIADRPWMAARGAGQVAVTWNEGGFWQRCAFTTNGGLTWSRTVPALTTNGLPIGGIPAFHTGGRLVYAGNGGVGGAAETLFRYPTASPCAGVMQELDLPPVGDQLSTHVVTDPSGGIYLATPTPDNKAMTIVGYQGWDASTMKRLTVSPPSLLGNTFGTIAIRGNGELSVTWYSTAWPGNFQNPSFNGHWNVTNARVKDFWSATPTIVFQQVTTQSHHVGDICMLGTNCDVNGQGDRDLLDYFSTAYDAAGNLHVAYAADGATSQARTYYAKLPALT